jgi:hypothetical protein
MGPNGRPRLIRAVSGYDAAGGSASGTNGAGESQSQQATHVDLITVIEYTGRQARKCDGTAIEGDLIIEYERRSTASQWTATARTRTPMEILAPPFDMLAGTINLEIGDRRQIGERMARAFIAPWRLPPGAQAGGPLPAGIVQSLWIDVASLLPLRWSISVPAMPERGAPAIPDYGLSFTYDPAIDLRPPDGITPPDCIR